MQTGFSGMMRDKRALLALAAAFALGAALVACALTLTSAAENGDVVAVVNGRPLTKAEFYERLELEAGEAVLERLIAEILVEQAQSTRNAAVSEDEVEAEVAKIREAYDSEEEFLDDLARFDLTPERLRHEIRLSLILDRLSQEGVVVTDDEIAEYFAANRELFDQKEAVAVSHILVETKEEAEAIARQLREGADFAELARAKSIDTASAVQGGAVGYIERDAPIASSFKEAAFSLEVGEISAPVESEFGWHLIKVTDRRAAREATLESSREQIRSLLMQEKARPVGEVIDELRSEATIEVRWSRYAYLANEPAPAAGQEAERAQDGEE